MCRNWLVSERASHFFILCNKVDLEACQCIEHIICLTCPAMYCPIQGMHIKRRDLWHNVLQAGPRMPLRCRMTLSSRTIASSLRRTSSRAIWNSSSGWGFPAAASGFSPPFVRRITGLARPSAEASLCARASGHAQARRDSQPPSR